MVDEDQQCVMMLYDGKRGWLTIVIATIDDGISAFLMVIGGFAPPLRPEERDMLERTERIL